MIVVCAIIARRSKKSIAFDVFLLEISLLSPILGNVLIITSGDWLISHIGGYMYYIGIDLTIAALLRFSTDFCGIRYVGTTMRRVVLALFALDMIQIALNPLFGHAFSMEMTIVEGGPYYALVPYVGQTIHRLVVYSVFIICILLFFYRTVTSPAVYLEKYLVILIAMLITGAVESYYIFLGIPIDASMIGYGLFGLLIVLLALYYRPVLLLNGILADVVGDMDDFVLFFDRDGACIYANETARTLFNLTEDDMERGKHEIVALIGEDQFCLDSEWACRCQVLTNGAGVTLPASSLRKVGFAGKTNIDRSELKEHFWQMSLRTMSDNRGRSVGSYIIVHDRTEEELRLRRERRIAERDPLTGLYNSVHLNNMAQRAMLENPGVRYCVAALDVREFKLINDVYSKEFGDRVLCAIADKLRACATPHEVFGRVSGDKFGFVLPAEELSEERIEQMVNLDDFGGNEITYPIVIHMGIYEVVEENLPISVMFDRAFMAIAPIKQDYSRRVAYYDNTMRDTAIWNQKISAELDNAILTGQIRPYLQPMMSDKGVIQGAEVLVRWIHPEEGFLPPVRFIPCFEENGRVAQIDLYMWECACKLLAKWQAMGLDLFLSVNISPKDFYFMDVPQTINNLVKKYNVDPKRLRLEITETVVMNDAENRLRIIEDLRASGFLVEMDDFGSGYSSLNMLKDMPVDLLKIDMMFLYKTKDQERAQTILQTIVNLSEQLGIPSITEGVETVEQLTMLTSMGCRLFQGYYFAKPMPVEDFEEQYCHPIIEGHVASSERGLEKADERSLEASSEASEFNAAIINVSTTIQSKTLFSAPDNL